MEAEFHLKVVSSQLHSVMSNFTRIKQSVFLAEQANSLSASAGHCPVFCVNLASNKKFWAAFSLQHECVEARIEAGVSLYFIVCLACPISHLDPEAHSCCSICILFVNCVAGFPPRNISFEPETVPSYPSLYQVLKPKHHIRVPKCPSLSSC